MNDKDLLELFQNGFRATSTSDSYSHLCNFVSAMRCGQYYPITDEEMCRGVEYKKAEGKALLKYLGSFFQNKDQRPAEALIDLYCNQKLQQFLNSKHTYEKQNRDVI